MSLAKKTASAISWSALERVASQGISFGIQVFLARLIEPSEFGLLALIVIFLLFSNLIVDGGFGQALIQKEKVDRIDLSSVFIFNVVSGSIMYAVMFFSAPHIADFYAEPRLTLLIRVLSINLIVRSLSIVQNCMLTRNLAFRKLFKISTPAALIGGVVGVGLALLGFEVWALVFSQLTAGVIATICYWVFSERDLWPRFEFSWGAFRSMSKFGFNMLAASFVYQGVQNLYGLLIGKYFSFDQLGFYNRARAFHRTPILVLTGVLNQVMFPVFSQIQNEDERILVAVRRGIPVIAFVVFPTMTFLICAADHIVIFLLTEKWLPAAKYMRWFPVVGMIYPIAAVLLSIVRAKGKSALFLRMDIIKNVAAILVLLFTIQHGLLSIVVGQVVISLAAHSLVNAPVFNRVFGYSLSAQVADTIPYALTSAIAGAISVLAVAYVTVQTHLFLAIAQAVILTTAYLVFCHCFRLCGYTAAVDQILKYGRKMFAQMETVK